MNNVFSERVEAFGWRTTSFMDNNANSKLRDISKYSQGYTNIAASRSSSIHLTNPAFPPDDQGL